MLTAALPKIASGWLDPSTLGVRAHVVHYHFLAPGDGLLGRLSLRTDSIAVWKPLDYFTLLFETGFAAAIFSPRWTRLFCAVAVVFHFGIFLAFGIDFTPSVAAYAVFFEWSAVADRVAVPDGLRALPDPGRRLLRHTRAAGAAVVLAGTALYLLRAHVGAPLRNVAPPVVANPDQAATLLVFAAAVPLAVAYIVFRGIRATRRLMRRAIEPVAVPSV
jgi:hypothetical protein